MHGCSLWGRFVPTAIYGHSSQSRIQIQVCGVKKVKIPAGAIELADPSSRVDAASWSYKENAHLSLLGQAAFPSDLQLLVSSFFCKTAEG